MTQRYRRAGMAEHLCRTPKTILLLVVVSLLSLGVRLAWISEPCHVPCARAAAHVLVFDEAYYVNAARVIAGIRPTSAVPPSSARYRNAPLGDDPNAEHPQLAKLVMAGAIELFGDGPFAWRIGSVLMGTLAIIGMFALVRAAGGSREVALGGATLMALDNLLLVQGRIGTLDIYAVAAMVWAVAAYLRGRPLVAGALIGIGACCKLVAPYVLIVLVLLELIGLLQARASGRRAVVLARAGAPRLAGCLIAAAVVFVGLLAVLDQIAPPFDDATGQLVAGGVFGHIGHMLSYAAQQTSPQGPSGIASYPWTWLIDVKPITYLNIDPSHPAPGLTQIHPPAHFLGMISPPILLAGLLSLLWLGRRIRRSRSSRVGSLAWAWTVGTFVPFVVLSLVWQRTSYLYYMTVVMPGLYIAAACGAVWLRHRRRRVFALWATAVVAAVVVMYPFTPLP